MRSGGQRRLPLLLLARMWLNACGLRHLAVVGHALAVNFNLAFLPGAEVVFPGRDAAFMNGGRSFCADRYAAGVDVVGENAVGISGRTRGCCKRRRRAKSCKSRNGQRNAEKLAGYASNSVQPRCCFERVHWFCSFNLVRRPQGQLATMHCVAQ